MPDKSPAELLLGAVDTLPKEERDQVLVWLLDPMSVRSAWTPHSASRLPELEPRVSEALSGRLAARRGEELQAVPVRLTSEQHAALREWCQAHGFSMATVIRGLVSRFLEGQATAAD